MKKKEGLTDRDVNRIIDPFEAIYYQFEFSEKEVICLMRKVLKQSSFKLWRKRVNSGVSQKTPKKTIKGYKSIQM